MVRQTTETTLIYDLGHRGAFDSTQITRFLALTPTKRLERMVRWRDAVRGTLSMGSFLEDILTRLTSERVEFLIVGGVSAVLQGVPISTLDLDICYRRTSENITRLIAALGPLRPRPRGFPADLPFVFDERTVQLGSNFTLEIGEEDLDLLGEMSGIGGYEQVIQEAVESIVTGVSVKLLSLRQLILTKEAAGREKDLAVLPLLRQTLAMKEERPAEHSDPRQL
jgi:hypothetical protein